MLMARKKRDDIVETSWLNNLCGTPKYYQNPLSAALNLFGVARQQMAADMGLTEGQVRHYLVGRTPIPEGRMRAALSVLKKAIVGARLALIETGGRRRGGVPGEASLLRAKIRAAEAHLRQATRINVSDDRELTQLYAKHLGVWIQRFSKPINLGDWPPASLEERAGENRFDREVLRILKAELKQLKAK
jgi:hypothetical protein